MKLGILLGLVMLVLFTHLVIAQCAPPNEYEIHFQNRGGVGCDDIIDEFCVNQGDDVNDIACCLNDNDCVYDGNCYTASTMLDLTGNGRLDGWCISNPDYMNQWTDCDNTVDLAYGCDHACNAHSATGGELEPFGEYDTGTSRECCGDDSDEYYIETNGNSACCNNPDDIVGSDGKCNPMIFFQTAGGDNCDDILHQRCVNGDGDPCEIAECTNNNMCDDIYHQRCINGGSDPDDVVECPNDNDCVFEGTCYPAGTALDLTGNGRVDGWCLSNPDYINQWADCDGFVDLSYGCGNEYMCNAHSATGGETEPFGEYDFGRTRECCGDDSNEYYIETDGNTACCDNPNDYVDAEGKCINCIHEADKKNVQTDKCDGEIDINEMVSFVGIWKYGQATIGELMEAIRLWKGCSDEWELVWSDEFNVDGLVDESKWSYMEGLIRGNEKGYNTVARSENIRVEGGNLIIEARKEQYPNAFYDPESDDYRYMNEFAEYTAGELRTLGKFHFLYGKLEMRAKLAGGAGTHNGFWTFGKNQAEVGWPHCGEIDIFEVLGRESNSIHGAVNTKEQNHFNEKNPNSIYYTNTGDSPFENFHTYFIEWDVEKIDFFVDDNKYLTFDNIGDVNFWPFDREQQVLIGLSLGTNWGGAIDDSSLPTRMYVDYVRYYQKKC